LEKPLIFIFQSIFGIMNLHVIKDSDGNSTGVFIPMEEWAKLVQKNTELNALLPPDAIATKRKSAITKSLHDLEEEALFKYFD